MDKVNEVLEILDKINTIVEGNPKAPYPEIYKLSGDAVLICNEIIRKFIIS